MPIMDGLEATRLIRSFVEIGNWEAASKAGIDCHVSPSKSLPTGAEYKFPRKRIRIIAVSTSVLLSTEFGLWFHGLVTFLTFVVSKC